VQGSSYHGRVHPAGWRSGALLRPETRGWVLAFLLGGSAAVVVVLAVAPLTVESTTEPAARSAVVLVVLGAIAVLARRSTGMLWLVTAATVLLDAWMLAEAQTLAGSMLVLSAFSYPVLYSAYAFEGRLLHAMLVLTTVVSAVGLARSDAGLRWVAWAAAVGGVVLAAVALGRVMALLRWYATVDTLTGVLTRSAFDAVATSAVSGSRRRGEPVVLVLLDLDGFKVVNDTHGHAAGDEVLVRTVEAWRSRLRDQDVLGRVGGDEFVLLLPGTGLEGARSVVADLVAASPTAFSAGMSLVLPDDSLDDAQRRADAGMYEVKRGRPDMGMTDAAGPGH
jgi:diguanylate cyclase (GGDEF)-like protein